MASAPQKRFSIEGFPGEGGRDGKIQGDNRYGGEHIDICSVFLLVLRVNQNWFASSGNEVFNELARASRIWEVVSWEFKNIWTFQKGQAQLKNFRWKSN